MKAYLEAGQIINTHGVRGEIKIDSWCDTPQILAKLKTVYYKDAADNYTPLQLSRAYVYKRFVIAHPADFSTFEDAVKMKNKIIYASRKDIPLAPGAHFVADLIGLPVYDLNTKVHYGTLQDVTNRGATDLYEIKTNSGSVVYIPVVDEFVAKITDEVIYLTPIPGMFDDAEEI